MFDSTTIQTAPVVYLLDTDSDHLARLEGLVAGEGFKSVSYKSVNQFLEQLREDSAGCLILEIDLPEIDGLGLQRLLADHGISMPLIFVVRSATIPEVVAAMQAGAAAFFQKPAPCEELLRAVNAAIERDAMQREKRARREDAVQRVELLTKRERQTMELLLQGKAVKQIAGDFGIGVQTVAKHRTRVLDKMGVPCDSQLVRLWLTNDLDAATGDNGTAHVNPPVNVLQPKRPPTCAPTAANFALVD